VTVEINYQTVSRAISLYSSKGYKYVDTPWMVSGNALEVTLPPDRHGFAVTHPEREPRSNNLVGSAEQGFIQLMLNAQIEPGSYCSAGPCFRDEPEVNELHRLCFFKLELIKIYAPEEVPQLIDTWKMAHLAKDIHAELYWLSKKSQERLRMVKTEPGYDLELAGIEVGSYGLREHAGHRWLYGTGLALPRAQIARAKLAAI
jgi:hypothetical protein